MSEAVRKPMTADEFIAWAMERPEGEHYELIAGEVVAMAPERSVHGLVKAWITRGLMNAIEAAGLPCDVYTDSTAVQIDDFTVYEPDVLVRCGSRLEPDAIKVVDPVIVVEVLSPSTRGMDVATKLEDYFRLPSLRHYLVVNPRGQAVIHHRRGAEDTIMSRIHHHGAVELDPPGIVLGSLFPPER